MGHITSQLQEVIPQIRQQPPQPQRHGMFGGLLRDALRDANNRQPPLDNAPPQQARPNYNLYGAFMGRDKRDIYGGPY